MTRPNLASTGWMVASFLAAIVLTSNGVVSAVSSTYVALTNSNGTRFVGITRAKQLLTAETDASDIVRIQGFTSTTCTTLYTVPAGKNLIIKSAVLYMIPNTGLFSTVALYLTECESSVALTYAVHDQDTAINQTYGEGIVVPGGAAVAVQQFSGTGRVFLYGHLVPTP